MDKSANGAVGNSIDDSVVASGEPSELWIGSVSKGGYVGASKVYGADYIVGDSGYVGCGAVGLGSGSVISGGDGV